MNEEQQDWVVTKQIAVTASSPEEAIAKSATEGKGMSISANVRMVPVAPAIQGGENARAKLAKKTRAKK